MPADHPPSPPPVSRAASGHPPTEYDIEELHELLSNIERDLLCTEISEVYHVLSNIFTNIVQNEKVFKYRTIPKSNEHVANNITIHSSVAEVMKAVGFQETEDEFICPESTHLDHMREAVHELRSIMITHGERAEVMTASISLYGPGRSCSRKMPSVRRVGTNDGATPTKSQSEMGSFRQPPPVWQWEHRKGFKSFDNGSCAKIEESFLNGDSKVRLKTGKVGTTPMEIFFEDMIQYDPVTMKKRKIQRIGHCGPAYYFSMLANGTMRLVETGRWRRETFDEYDTRRMQLRQRSSYVMTGSPSIHRSLVRRALPRVDKGSSEDDLYKEDGIFSAIVRSHLFLAAQITAILLNAVWLWVEADLEDELSLSRGADHVVAIENAFCAFFTTELLIRYGAFRKWWNFIFDRWFLFDLVLALFMVGETWILPLYLEIMSKDSDGNAFENLSVLRTMRLFRLTRLVHVLHAVPEVLMLLRGLSSALHSVLFTVLLLMVILFAFGIVFKSQTKDYAEIQAYYFATVPEAMLSLLMYGTLLDSPSSLARKLKDQNVFLVLVFLFFLFVTAFAVLGVLIGILCEVVDKVSEAEREEAEVSYLQRNLLGILDVYDRDGKERLGRGEFNLFMQNPEVHDVLRKFGTDPEGLNMLQDVLFPEHTNEVTHTENHGDQLPFQDFFEIVMRLRGGKAASVTDLVDLRLYVRKRHDQLADFLVQEREATPSAEKSRSSSDTLDKVLECLQKMSGDVDRLQSEMSELRQEIRSRPPSKR